MLSFFDQSPRIWTADPNVIQYILQHAYDYPKDDGMDLGFLDQLIVCQRLIHFSPR
jgi:hypothetical protein